MSGRSKTQQVFHYIQQEWDTTSTMFVAVAVVFLSTFRLVDSGLVLDAILFIFIILAVTTIRNRVINEKLKHSIETVDDHMSPIEQVAGKLDDITQVARDLPDMKRLLQTDLPPVVNLLKTFKVYETQDEANKYIFSYVDDGAHKIQKATIISYSIPDELVSRLLRKGVHVTVFIQDKETAQLIKSSQQIEWIEFSWDLLRRSLPRPLEDYPISIYQYRPPASIAGVKFDDQLLYMSWYTYEYVDESNKFTVPVKYRNTDEIIVHGNNKATLIAQKDYQEYGLLNRTFESVVDNYKKNAKCALGESDEQAQDNGAILPAPSLPLTPPANGQSPQ